MLYENVNVEKLTKEEISQMDNLIKRQLHSKNLNPKEKERNYDGIECLPLYVGFHLIYLMKKKKKYY